MLESPLLTDDCNFYPKLPLQSDGNIPASLNNPDNTQALLDIRARELEEVNTLLRIEILELQRVQTALKAAECRAEMAEAAKARFLSHMNHELRTPLNAIMGFSELMQLTLNKGNPQTVEALAMGGKINSYASDIHNSGKQLLGLIDNILEIAEIDQGVYQLSREPIDVVTTIRACLRAVSPEARVQRVYLDFRCTTSDLTLLVDKQAFRQIILNLLTNAVRYHRKKGMVLVNIEVLPQGGGVKLTICDDGVGMSETALNKALNLFDLSNPHQRNQNRGAGLGLPLTRSLVEMHDGAMTIKSRADEGTTITIFLPEATICKPTPQYGRVLPQLEPAKTT